MHVIWFLGLMISSTVFKLASNLINSNNEIDSNISLNVSQITTRNQSTNMHLEDLLQITFSEQLFHEVFNNSFRNNHNNITVQLGATAFLHCHLRVPHAITINQILLSPSEQATWIRKRNWHILAFGTAMYTSDDRYRVIHPEGSTDWILEIRYVQSRDNGSYICQIATKYGIIYRQIHLNVVVSQAVIQGLGNTAEYHVDIGSEINLLCVIEPKSTSIQHYIFWYHNDRMINYDSFRGGIVVENKADSQKTGSQLTIKNALISDSGNYTCSASNAVPTSIYVFVSEGDKMAAILRRKSTGSMTDTSILFQSLYFLIIWILR